jgi:hypothetical protein
MSLAVFSEKLKYINFDKVTVERMFDQESIHAKVTLDLIFDSGYMFQDFAVQLRKKLEQKEEINFNESI